MNEGVFTFTLYIYSESCIFFLLLFLTDPFYHHDRCVPMGWLKGMFPLPLQHTLLCLSFSLVYPHQPILSSLMMGMKPTDRRVAFIVLSAETSSLHRSVASPGPVMKSHI